MKTLIRTMVAAALVAGCGLVVAQGASSPAKKELVNKVLQLQQGGIDHLARVLVEQSAAPIVQMTRLAIQQKVAPDQREAVARDVQAELKKYGDEMLPVLRERARKLAPSTMGAVLEEKFSEDELKQVIATLENPTFRKYQQTSGEMQKALTEKLVAETRSTVEPRLNALQEALGKRLGLPTKPAAGTSTSK